MLHVMSTWCVACDLHTIAPWPLEQTCWRQFAAQWGDCKKKKIFNCSIQCDHQYYYDYHNINVIEHYSHWRKLNLLPATSDAWHQFFLFNHSCPGQRFCFSRVTVSALDQFLLKFTSKRKPKIGTWWKYQIIIFTWNQTGLRVQLHLQCTFHTKSFFELQLNYPQSLVQVTWTHVTHTT